MAQVRMVCLEDGITSCGFRKMAAYVARLIPDTETCYISTERYRSVRTAVRGMGDKAEVSDDQVDEMAQGLADADLIGFSSMTGYAALTHRVIRRVRELNPSAFLIWGGIHPIIQPEDAILAPVDAVCTGEGEFAFEQFLDAYDSGRDHTRVRNFWFKRDSSLAGAGDDRSVVKNDFLPLMTPDEMETLPFPQYGAPTERIYMPGRGFVPMGVDDYLINDGLGYTTLWSIGCPFHCTYCGNTKFIANDSKYKRIRHPSPRYMVDQVNDARKRFPHISQVSFHDDSFMAIPYRQLEEFAELWHDEVGLPFCVYGVIPNYVRQDKFELLTWAGMNRVRMGIQSGSQDMLDFYKRPTPPAKILEAGKVIASFAPKYHIPAAYDIIMDNPVETRADVKATLQLLYDMDRPFTLYIYSLRAIPNTELAAAIEARGIDLEKIDETYLAIPPRLANLMLYLIAIWRPPEWMWRRLMKRVRASSEPQRLYPRLGLVLRTTYLTRRVLSHARRMDFSITPGKTGYYAWKLGLVGLWRRRFTPRYPRPDAPPAVEVVVGEGSDVRVTVPVGIASKPRESLRANGSAG